jgi:hypothetical protein
MRRHKILRRRAVAISVALLLALIAAVIAVADPGGPQPPGRGSAVARTTSRQAAAPPVRATISLVRGAATTALPRSFFGFSIEVWDAMHDAQYLALFKRAVDLVRVPGDGPEVLRIGGNSTDQSYWHSRLPTGSPRSFELGPTWLHSVRAIVRALHTKVILGLNAVAREPAMAASEARALLHALPAHSVGGFEIGNEPDLYWYRFRLQFAADSHSIIGLAAEDRIFSVAGYVHAFSDYAAALRKVAPTTPLVGPAVSNPFRGLRWLSALVRSDRASLGMLSAHRYPLSACVHNPSSPVYPTIARLLSPQSSAGMAASVRKAVALAHRSGLKFRLTEFNSVTCLGRLGVSNTFATALWAPDAMFQMFRAHVDGMNLHLRIDSPNAPFVLSPSGFDARPAFYGLVAFTRTLGPGARLAPVNLHVRGAEMSAWAVRLADNRLHLLVLDKSNRAARMRFVLPNGLGAASVERLLAPSVAAEQGVTFAGQSLNASGHWVGRRVVGRLARRGDAYSLTVPAYSGALISLRLR